MLTLLDVFSGVAGFSLAGHWAGFDTVAFVEWEPFCQQVIKKNFPGVPVYGDITKISEEEFSRYSRVTVLTAGFPCQPASCAGKRRGVLDDRWMWTATFRAIRAVHPHFCLLENVPALCSLEAGVVFESILSDLEGEGYEVVAFLIPALAVGAFHRRERLWIVADTTKMRWRERNENAGGASEGTGTPTERGGLADSSNVPDSDQFNDDGSRPGTIEICREREQAELPGCENATDAAKLHCTISDIHEGSNRKGFNEIPEPGIGNSAIGGCVSWWQSEPDVGRSFARISPRLDEIRRRWHDGTWEDGIPRVTTEKRQRVNRLKALGNSIVPQIAYELLMSIKEVIEHERNA